MTDHTAAALLLYKAAALLDGDQLQPSVQHLARACQLRARQEAATVQVELPVRHQSQITIRQEGADVVMIDQTTGEKRRISLEDFVAHPTPEQAWRSAG